jgi:pyruvate carboxylase
MKHLINPKKSPKEIIKTLRKSREIFLTNTAPRDTGQSDYKNRHTLYDLIKLAPVYNEAHYFSVEMHGGARFHQDLLNNKINPFDECRAWRAQMPDVLTQTLIRATNAWGYRMYPRNVVKLAVRAFEPYIDVWRCFDFLNYIPNMAPVAEEVRAAGKLFEPAISFTVSTDCTNQYYLKVTKEIIGLAGGYDEIILCIKDMAGVGSPARIKSLVRALLDKYPDMVIQYHRHGTDGLALAALLEAARSGVKILDVTDDAFSRFYGQAPVRPVAALLRENDITVNLEMAKADHASDIIRTFINHYEPFESQLKGFSYDVTAHKMPGGAFPSSFEQAEKGKFLELMPWILKGMALGNRLVKYFDVTPGSQITWTTWASIIQRFHKEGGEQEVLRLIHHLERFLEDGQRFEQLSKHEQKIFLKLFSHATDDFKNLLLGKYGPLPFGWPQTWVYQSTFGDDWQKIVKEQRVERSPLEQKADEDLEKARQQLHQDIGRLPSEEELVLYLQHPKSTVDFIKFRADFGDTTVLSTDVWFYGLRHPGDKVSFRLNGKPHEIQLISIGEGKDFVKYLVLSVDNVFHEFPVEMPGAQKPTLRKADPSNPGEAGSPVKGTIWRIGDKDRELKVGDFVKKGQEILNIEVMKTENAVRAPIAGAIKEICIKLNETAEAGQLLVVIREKEGN